MTIGEPTNECGQHAGLVRYHGGQCPMCRAIDLLIRANIEINYYIGETDDNCGSYGCRCTYEGVEDCSQHLQDLHAEIAEFVS